MQDLQRALRATEEALAQAKRKAEVAELDLGIALSLAARTPEPSDARLANLLSARGWVTQPCALSYAARRA